VADTSDRTITRVFDAPRGFTVTAFETDLRPGGPATLMTVTLAARGDQTEMTFQQTGFESDEDRGGHREGCRFGEPSFDVSVEPGSSRSSPTGRPRSETVIRRSHDNAVHGHREGHQGIRGRGTAQ